MNDDAILERAAAARRYTVTVDGRLFICALPDIPATLVELAALFPQADVGRLPASAFSYAGALASVVQWEGVLESDLFTDAPAEPQPFSRVACRHLLREKDAWRDALVAEYIRRAAAREAVLEPAEKN